MNKPELLRQIATAMEQDPDGWWRGFEFLASNGEWCQTRDQAAVFMHLQNTEIRPRPRTIRIDVEVPEPMREVPEAGEEYWFMYPICGAGVGDSVWYGNSDDRDRFKRGIWPTKAEAQQAAAAIFGALGGGK